LAANEAVARHFRERALDAVWRVHDVPADERLEKFAEIAGSFGLKFDPQEGKDPRKMRDFLERVNEGPHADGVKRARGIAIHRSFGSVVAQVAEVSLTQDKQIRVHRVHCVIDCGTPVNPNLIRQQMESAIVYGLSAALHGEITIDKGQVQQSNFHDYAPLRIDECPAIEVEIIASDEHPGGVGEPGTPPIAPAVANAVYALTGQRLRSLPLKIA